MLLLDQKAEELMLQASKARTEFDKIKLEAQANLARQRKQKLLESRGYAKSFTQRLLENTGSKWKTAEVVSNISELESRVRCQLTWQAFDSALYMATLASAQELKASGFVAAPEQYVQARSEHFIVGFSDQVPLWAKSQGKKALFAQHEMHLEHSTKDFSEVRDAIAEALSNKHEPGLVVGTLPRHQGQALSTPDFRKQGSHTSFTSAAPSSFERKSSLDTDISSPGSIKKKLSFEESGNDEAVTSAAKDSATASQEPKASAEEQPATAASQEPKASAEEQPATAASDEPKASAKEQPATAASDEPKASAKEQPATAASHEPKASAKKPSANTSAPGSLTVVGHSTDERHRITYEARQLISGLDGSGSKPEGHVGKGLLVVPGTWARLSNISDDGRRIKHEEFQVGSKTFVHGQGRSVGRVLESWRQLRKDRPELFERIEVMSQPAANVDSLILSWVIESQAEQYPASLWQRDCFASVFSTTATEAMHLANQISTLVAAKCTSKLQITDSDFSKQFKSLVKGKLQQLRHDFQQKYQQDAAWKVGSLEILESVVFAQEEMSKKNLEDEWVLKAAIRNGILGYIPSQGKLQKVTECSWAQAEGFQMGTKRIPSDWFKDRFSWLSPDGKPIEPDWSLSDSASEIADLQRWDYHSKEDEQHDSADEGQHLELVELKVNLKSSLSSVLRTR